MNIILDHPAFDEQHKHKWKDLFQKVRKENEDEEILLAALWLGGL